MISLKLVLTESMINSLVDVIEIGVDHCKDIDIPFDSSIYSLIGVIKTILADSSSGGSNNE